MAQGNTSITIRIPVKYCILADEIAKHTNSDRSKLIRDCVINGIKNMSTEMIFENSKMDELTEELKDAVSAHENRISSLLSKTIITNYENRGILEELLKLLAGQIYSEEQVEETMEEIMKKVNTEAIVKIKGGLKQWEELIIPTK